MIGSSCLGLNTGEPDTKLLIAGGAGFIGSNFIRRELLGYKDVEILNVDKLTYSGRLENLRDVEKNSRYGFVRGDVQDRATIEELVEKGVDVVVNFAAETHVDRSIVEGGAFVLTDVYGTFNLLEMTRKYDVKRFVQVSTDEVYGSVEEGSFEETDSLSPSSPYSASKAGADMMVKAFHTTYGLDVVITRGTNNFGPYQYPEKLIPKLILRALHDEPLPLYGNGKQVRDWIYVEDHCDAIDMIMREGKSGEVYNIGSGVEHANVEVAKAILGALEKPRSMIKFVADRPGHDQRYSLNADKVRKLGWKPKHAFDKALRKTIKWYSGNEWWWQPLLKDRYVQADTPWAE